VIIHKMMESMNYL